MKPLGSKLAAIFIAASFPVLAQAAHTEQHIARASQSRPAATLSEGEVKRIDKQAGKITLKHGPLENLGMPGMTMVFRAQDPASLDKVKVGDSVQFRVERIDGALTVVELRQRS
jgi:Cu(I)/Ag(I) efflux system periplasmic protein CusF